VGDFPDSHTGKDAHFNHTLHSRIESRKARQCAIQCNSLVRRIFAKAELLVPGDSLLTTTALLSRPSSRMIYEDPAHDTSSYGVEVGPALPLDLRLVDEPYVGLVHQGRRLQGVVSSLALHETSGNATHLVINRLVESIRNRGGGRTLSVQLPENLRDVCWMIVLTQAHLDLPSLPGDTIAFHDTPLLLVSQAVTACVRGNREHEENPLRA
jgi:hypothetical protein